MSGPMPSGMLVMLCAMNCRRNAFCEWELHMDMADSTELIHGDVKSDPEICPVCVNTANKL